MSLSNRAKALLEKYGVAATTGPLSLRELQMGDEVHVWLCGWKEPVAIVPVRPDRGEFSVRFRLCGRWVPCFVPDSSSLKVGEPLALSINGELWYHPSPLKEMVVIRE